MGMPAVSAVEDRAREDLGAAPEAGWRMTSICAPSASSVRTVSTSDSPFVTELLDAAMFTTSAERFFAATSKETRVRVEAS